MSQLDDTSGQSIRQQLEELLEINEGEDLLRNIFEWILQELIELEFNQQIGAKRYGRSEKQQGYRNGYRVRDIFTRVSRITLRVPRDREGRFCMQLSEQG